MNTFTPVPPQRVSPRLRRRAGQHGKATCRDRPDLTFRIEAAAYHGRVVFFGITGPWTRSARAEPAPPSRFNRIVEGLASADHAGPDDRRRAPRPTQPRDCSAATASARARAASFLLVVGIVTRALMLAHTSDMSIEVGRLFSDARRLAVRLGGVVGHLSGSGAVRPPHRTDSLIGWTRLVSGRWNDPHVGRDVLIGVSAGLLMTLLFPLYYLLPPLAGRLEPMPVLPDLRPLMGLRYVIWRAARRSARRADIGNARHRRRRLAPDAAQAAHRSRSRPRSSSSRRSR